MEQALTQNRSMWHKTLYNSAAVLTACVLPFTCNVYATENSALDTLAQAAEKNGKAITWYESSPEDQIKKVLEAFNQDYPKVQVKYVRLVGGNELASRVIQEEQAAGRSADVLTGGPDHLWQLNERHLLLEMDATTLGLSEALLPVPYAIPTAASIYVQIWNTRKVPADAVPNSWEELINPTWKNKIGNWVRAAAFTQLASVWGVDKAEEELRKFVQLKPYLFKSTFPLAQGVASGEVDIAIGFYHSMQPVMQAGAPVDYKLLNPTPMHTISSSIAKSSVNPDAAQLLAVWLTTSRGATAYEEATSRGNPFVEGTNAHEMLSTVEVADWPFDKSSELAELTDKFNAILADGATVK
ncbi:MAG: ABC transporter substrate-binding protein [Paenalcaligenes sp.]